MNFETIPILNSSQHLHLLPGIWGIALKLCKRHRINYIRLPKLTLPDKLWFIEEFCFSFLLAQQLVFKGTRGLNIGKIFNEVKRRPQYFKKEEVGIQNNKGHEQI